MKRIYFSGIGGVGIGPLAEIALDSGFNVVGTDQSDSALTKSLTAKGVTISHDQSGAFLETTHRESSVDWYVHTSAMKQDHPEIVKARELGLRVSERDELLVELITHNNLGLIAVSGTHGKTSTTAMIVWCMQQLGEHTSYSVGAPLSFAPSGAYAPGSKYFIYECDEFNRNMLHFHPTYTLIPSLDFDHRDTYPTIESYKDAFRQYIEQSSELIAHPDIFSYLGIVPRKNDTKIDQLRDDITLSGIHTRSNANLVHALLSKLGYEAAKISAAINAYPGAGRRFEKIAENIYSDYGHHPREITATLELATEINSNVTLVYQPHQNIRQYDVMNDYAGSMDAASAVYWLPTYLSREDPSLEVLSAKVLSEKAGHTAIHLAEMNDELLQIIRQRAREGSLVLCMGAGSIDGWLRDHTDALQ